MCVCDLPSMLAWHPSTLTPPCADLYITISFSLDLSSLNVMKSMPLMWLSWKVGLCGRPALSSVGLRLVPWQSQCTNTCTGSHTPTCKQHNSKHLQAVTTRATACS